MSSGKCNCRECNVCKTREYYRGKNWRKCFIKHFRRLMRAGFVEIANRYHKKMVESKAKADSNLPGYKGWCKDTVKATGLCDASVQHYARLELAPKHPKCFSVWLAARRKIKLDQVLERRETKHSRRLKYLRARAARIRAVKGVEYLNKLKRFKELRKTPKFKAYIKNYYIKIAPRRRAYQKTKRATCPVTRLKCSMRRGMQRMVERFKVGKSDRTFNLIGCSAANLKAHLEKQFHEGMSWENYGRWHIDHIMPLAAFDLTSKDQQLKAWHFTNLQPLWMLDNLIKGDTIPNHVDTNV